MADNLIVSGSGVLVFDASSTITDSGAGMSLTLNASGGTLVLSGSDSYTGGTDVMAGSLVVTNPNAISDGTSLTVGDASLFAPAISGAAPLSAYLRDSTAVPVPEPGTLALVVVGAVLLLVCRGRRPR